MKKILIAAVMLLTFSVAASAQALLQVGSTPVTTVASCGTTELTGDVVFARATSSLAIVQGTITISYGVPITSIADLQLFVNDVQDAIGAQVDVISTDADRAAGRLILSVDPGTGPAIDSIIVKGVRVNIAGNPDLSNLTATVTATGNSFVGGQTSVVVISSISSAIATVASANNLLNVSSVNPLGGTVNVTVTEGFLNAWVPNAMIALTFSTPPAGVNLSVPASITNDKGTEFQFATALGANATPATLTSASPSLTVFYRLTTPGATSAITTETLVVPVTVTFAGTPRPLAQGSVTVTANMGPTAGTVGLGAYVPQYAGTSCQRGPATILNIVTANTVLLIPYATNEVGFDTGFAIANTTTDPLAAPVSAVKQSGTLTFHFFPQTGTAFSYTTTAGSPGQGLNASGALETGRLYTVLLTELLAAAEAEGDFAGYIFVVANFTNAHGQYFISDFESFTNGALMLVVDPAFRVVSGTPEQLNN